MRHGHVVAAQLRRFPIAFAVVLALVATIASPSATRSIAVAAAAAGPLATIVVGPVGTRTSDYIAEAKRLATELKASGATVRTVYSPNATWSRVTTAARGANLLVYLGHGRGHPGPYGAFAARTMNGLALNRVAGSGHANVRHYGEYYLRASIRLAPGAVVILNRVPYAAGSSEPGRANPTRAAATRRADGYAAGFLRAGASAVFATDHSPGSIVRDLMGSDGSMQSIFWRSPWTSTRYDSAFGSSRTPGSRGILAPYGAGRYYQSIVGELTWTTSSWRQTWTTPPSSPTPTTNKTVRVSTVPALLSALANDSVDEIVVADGTYRVSPAGKQRTNSLWIGRRFAARTRPVTVRAETRGGVTFDGAGATSFGGLWFADGAHHQTWDGFVFANGQPTSTGVIMFGEGGGGAPHHITLRHVTIAASCTGAATSATAPNTDHAIYVSQAIGGPHDLRFDDVTVDGTGGLASAFHFYHSDATQQNAWNVTIRRLRVIGTQQAIMLWDRTLHDITVDGAVITDALRHAVTYERPGQDIVLQNITSTGSGRSGFYSTLGSAPPGITFLNNAFD